MLRLRHWGSAISVGSLGQKGVRVGGKGIACLSIHIRGTRSFRIHFDPLVVEVRSILPPSAALRAQHTI